MSILTALLLAALALVIGVFIGRQSSPGKQETGELKQQLSESEKHFNDYRHDVQQHFQQTAHLVGRLTENYRSLYQHLASGSRDLTSDGKVHELYRPELLGLTQRPTETVEAPLLYAAEAAGGDHNEHFAPTSGSEPPKDYSPESHGIMGAAPQAERA